MRTNLLVKITFRNVWGRLTVVLFETCPVERKIVLVSCSRQDAGPNVFLSN